mmetsp:Transcript_74664/g.136368  ORF Transcript_74664/g.136368 Transcript_74664/m.136368 type:complete len:321 (+) Transcript_74664:66-1028(+)
MMSLSHRHSRPVMDAGCRVSRLAPTLRPQSVCQKARLAISAFFFASGGEESSDYLVELVRLDASAACWFIEMTMAFSIVGGIFVCVACAIFLSLYWAQCSECNRPLRVWLLGQCFLQVMQLPVRLVLYSSLRAIERGGGSIEACVVSITMAPAWCMSKAVSLLHYGWFVLGVVWWVNSTTCATCPGISMLLISVLLFCAARAIVALVVFQFVFPAHTEPGQQASRVEPATVSQIAALALVDVKAASAGPALGTTCVVCLADFDEGDVARKLPCGHHFHKGCIDRWLQRNKRCPLCMHPVDKAFSGHPPLSRVKSAKPEAT